MIEIYNEDCMALMARYPDKYFELAIVDPPYGIGYSKRAKRDVKHNSKYKPKNWDNKTPSESYWKELKRVSVNQIVWGGNYFELGTTRCYLAWIKQPPTLDQSSMELAWTSFNKVSKHFNYHVGNESGFAPKSLPTDKPFANIHPTQKPVALYKWLLKNYATAGYKILDTHLGSGSIAIACHDMGFSLVASEIDREYFSAAKHRFEQHKSQLQLF